jgi:CRISPR-associated protein Csd1
MILQALKEYYDRKAADPDSGIAPLGWERKEIPFRVVFNSEGRFIRLEDTREGNGNHRRAKPFIVPSLGEGKGNGIKSNLFWENAEYLFGIAVDDEKRRHYEEKYLDRVKKQHECFLEKIRSLQPRLASNPIYKASLLFAETISAADIEGDPLWAEAKTLNQSFLMCLATDSGPVPIPDFPDIKVGIPIPGIELNDEGAKIRCLVTGEMDCLAKLEPNIKGVKDASTMGAHVVSINNKVSGAGNGGATPAFASFGKEQGENSPIGKRASLAYTTALNTLLGKDSRQKMQVGDATTVFWSEKPTELEDEFLDLFGEPEKDEPEKGVAAVERLLSSVRTGAFSHEDETTKFYVLGLAPNSARISVRFWHNGTVAEMERRFADWFENLRIAHGSRDKEHLSLQTLLLSIARYNKDRQKWKENIPPNLAGAVMRSILEGTPYPATLLSSAILRIKAEHEVTYPRAKFIKAFLNHNLNKERKLTVSLDKENANVGYRLGRLFAVLEKTQIAAINPEKTIREKFYASASTNPVTVFGNLMRLSGYHLSKLDSDKKGLRIWLEKQIEEIMSGIGIFPSHLSLEEQGMFAIGYYHQRIARKADEKAEDASSHESL